MGEGNGSTGLSCPFVVKKMIPVVLQKKGKDNEIAMFLASYETVFLFNPVHLFPISYVPRFLGR